MKKLILVISSDPNAKNWKDCIEIKQNLCKLVVIDTEQDEEDQNFEIITLHPDYPNRLNSELLDELSSPDNRLYVLICEHGNDLIGPEVFRNINIRREKEPMAQYFILTERERQIAHFLSKKYTYKEIANEFGIKFSTAKHHIENIYFKWNINSKKEASDLYKKYGPLVN